MSVMVVKREMVMKIFRLAENRIVLKRRMIGEKDGSEEEDGVEDIDQG